MVLYALAQRNKTIVISYKRIAGVRIMDVTSSKSLIVKGSFEGGLVC